MGRSRFVTPNIARLELSDDDWIEVKERLTYGEQQRLNSAGLRYREKTEDGVVLDMERLSVTRLATWIVDWSFDDADGKRVGVSEDAIWALDPETAREIDAALSAHIAGQESKNQRAPTKSGRSQKSQ